MPREPSCNTSPISARWCASTTTDKPARRTPHRAHAEHRMVQFAPRRKALLRLGFRPPTVSSIGSLHFSMHHRKPNTGKTGSPIRTRFGTCVMSVPFQGEISMTIRGQQLRNSTAAPADRPHDEHRVIVDAWPRCAIDGIRQIHLDEGARREVAGRIF